MKNRKKLWIYVSITIILGIILTLIGFFTGNKTGVYFDINGMHIIEGKLQEEKQLDLEEIKAMDINISYFDVIFEEADTYGIEIRSKEDIIL